MEPLLQVAAGRCSVALGEGAHEHVLHQVRQLLAQELGPVGEQRHPWLQRASRTATTIDATICKIASRALHAMKAA